MNVVIRFLLPLFILSYAGCASFNDPVMKMPLKNGTGTYDVSYKHIIASGYWECYQVNFEMASDLFFASYKTFTIRKNLYDREAIVDAKGTKVLSQEMLSFYHNKIYDVAPAVVLFVDGRPFTLAYYSGSSKTVSRVGGGTASAFSVMTYVLSRDVIAAMKTMTSLTFQFGTDKIDLDANLIAATRSFCIDTDGMDFKTFAGKVAASKL
ncbi:MAG: hypothetical protein EPN93_14960 [Spirochaetes bacterium]|nr:MAG: hypothetical protein EPN93_14960 [Spirochaetota bacterium]